MRARSIPMEEWKCDPSQIMELLDKHNVTSEFSVYRNACADMFLMWKHGKKGISYILLRDSNWMALFPEKEPVSYPNINPLWFKNSYMPEGISPGLLPYIAMGV